MALDDNEPAKLTKKMRAEISMMTGSNLLTMLFPLIMSNRIMKNLHLYQNRKKQNI
jgi:hypothetical protein